MYGFKHSECILISCNHYRNSGTALKAVLVSGPHIHPGGAGTPSNSTGTGDGVCALYPGSTVHDPSLDGSGESPSRWGPFLPPSPSWISVTLFSFPGLVGRMCSLWPWACRRASASYRSSRRTLRCLLCCLSLWAWARSPTTWQHLSWVWPSSWSWVLDPVFHHHSTTHSLETAVVSLKGKWSLATPTRAVCWMQFAQPWVPRSTTARMPSSRSFLVSEMCTLVSLVFSSHFTRIHPRSSMKKTGPSQSWGC